MAMQHALTCLSLTCIFACSLGGCFYFRDDQGNSSFVHPVIGGPLAVGVAVADDATDVKLTIEVIEDTKCMRIVPLDMHRIVLSKQDANESIVYSQFVSKKKLLIQETSLVKGSYKVRLFHQDHPTKSVTKNFTITDLSPLVSLKLPCLD